MPGSVGEISREEFFTSVIKYLVPVMDRSKKIGFCFSYATEILPNKDGRLLQFSKEVQVRDMIGELIGENLLRTMKAMGYSDYKKIVLLNDTVATLIGGKASYPDRLFDSYIGFILGTGTNTCYIEENSMIKKVPDVASREGTMIINMESGGYNRICRGIIDTEFDNGTINPGEYTFEKMISGRYQGELLLSVVKKAACDGLFSRYFEERVSSISGITTREMNDYLYYPYGSNRLSECCMKGSDDDITLYYLIDSIVERAAKLVMVNLASIMLKTGKGKNPCEPVCITADGSTFYKSKLFRGKLEYYMKEFLNDEMGLYCEFVKSENVTLIGTAIAGLLNE
jgi:hexokinase